jgi:hypothetical protein
VSQVVEDGGDPGTDHLDAVVARVVGSGDAVAPRS